MADVLDAARRWLPGRRGFSPTPTGPSDNPVMNDRLRGLDRVKQLADFVGRHAERRFGSAKALGIDAARCWFDGSFAFGAETARDIA